MPQFEKAIELLFDKLWQARPGLKLDLGKESLEVFLYQLVEGLAQVLPLPLAALPELVDGERRQLLGARLKLGQELLDVAGRRGEELALYRFAGRAVARFAERALQEIERLRLGLPRVGPERPGS